MSYYLIDPVAEESRRQYNCKAIEQFRIYQSLASQLPNSTIPIYTIVVINNSRNTYGIIAFIQKNSNLIGRHIQIYTIKNCPQEENNNSNERNSQPLFHLELGTTYIENREILSYITHYLVNSIPQIPYLLASEDVVMDSMKEYFACDPNEKLLFYSEYGDIHRIKPIDEPELDPVEELSDDQKKMEDAIDEITMEEVD